MVKKIFIILSLCLLSLGCRTVGGTTQDAKDIIAELERANEARAIEYAKLEKLYNSEREGNQELRDLNEEIQGELDDYAESERRRIEAEREYIDSIAGIFGTGQEIIDQLIQGLDGIGKTILSNEDVE